uniref:HEAT repeat protein n=1 Tax=Setaria digitata TaxID=48799 RepID=A0A915PME6_9BILA
MIFVIRNQNHDFVLLTLLEKYWRSLKSSLYRPYAEPECFPATGCDEFNGMDLITLYGGDVLHRYFYIEKKTTEGGYKMVQTLEDLVMAMFDCAVTLSSPEGARDDVAESLSKIGIEQPTIFLSAAYTFLMQHNKLTGQNRAFVLSTVNRVLEHSQTPEDLDEQQALLIINLATQEMTLSKENDDWPLAACNVLVTLAKRSRFVGHVMEALLQKFPPGQTSSPHRCIVLALASVAEHNAIGFVPFLTDVLSRAISVLPHIRMDTYRYVWAHALRAFCESVREYASASAATKIDACGGSDDAEDGKTYGERKTVQKNYADQMELAYDPVFSWLSAKDIKVRAEAANCVGELCLMISPKHLVDELRKLIPAFLNLHRKISTDQHLGLCRFLEAACADESCPLDAYLEDILNALFPLVYSVAEQTVASNVSMHNQSEAFRCFHVAATRFADKIVYYLLHKMQSMQDSSKLGAINILRHLLNSAGPYIEDKRSLVILGLKPILLAGSEGLLSIRVKKAMCQLCVALADHEYIDVEGGNNVIIFLVKNLIVQEDETTKKAIFPLEMEAADSAAHLRTQCGQALQTIAKTSLTAHNLLWPYLFEFICVQEYNIALTDIFKCIRILAERTIENGEKPDYGKGFESPHVAGNLQVFSRLITCLNNAPLNLILSKRAAEGLRLLSILASWFHNSLRDVLPRRCEELLVILKGLSPPGTLNNTMEGGRNDICELRLARIARWHAHVLDLLDLCLRNVNDGEWRCTLAAAMGKQFNLYTDIPEEKAFLMRCLGAALASSTNTSFVVDHLVLLFRSTSHAYQAERTGCAQAVGYCATTHTDLVLTELENIAKWENFKKSSGLFGFIKDAIPYKQYSDQEMVNLRATIMLSYGYVIYYCPTDVVTQRLEQTVFVFLRRYLENPKQDVVVKEALLETIYLIAVSVSPTHLITEYHLESRTELLNHIKEYIECESPETLSNSVRLLAGKAVAALVALDPALSDDDIWQIGYVLTNHTFPLCRERSGLKTIDDDESSTMMEATVNQYHAAIEQIVKKKAVVDTVTHLLKLFQPYYASVADHERLRAVDATLRVLTVYFEHARDFALGRASEFGPMSSLLARLVPRIADSLCAVRHAALRAVYWTFRLAHVYKGLSRDSIDNTLFDPVVFIKEYLGDEGKLEGMLSRKAVKVMADITDSRLPQSQLQTYLSGLFGMLNDRQSQVSSAGAQLLTSILTHRGDTLSAEADTLVTTLLNKLPDIHACVQTYTDLLAALIAFAYHQLYACIDVMLAKPLPYSVSMIDAWHTMSHDRSLFPLIADYLLELITTGCDSSETSEVPFEVLDTGAGSSVKIVKPEAGEPEVELLKRIPNILAALLQFLAAVVDTQYPVLMKEKDGAKSLIITPELRRLSSTPAALASQALRSLFLRTLDDAIVEKMNSERAWSDCVDTLHFTNGIAVLTRSVSEHRPEWIRPLVTLMMPRMQSPSDAYRIAAVAVLSALTKRCPDEEGEADNKLLEALIASLMKALEDRNLKIRKLAVRGLGDLACCNDSILNKYSSDAIQAAMAGLDDSGDRRDEIAMEAVNALNKLSTRVSNMHLENILSNVLLKLRPCFEKESSALRAVSFSLFGELGQRVGSCDAYREQLLVNIVSIVLHLNDEEDQVKQMCARCLVSVCSLLNSDSLASLIERELKVDEQCYNYRQFLKEFSVKLAFSFPDRINYYALSCNNYFKSTSCRIRANAAHMTGYLLGDLTPELRSTVSKELIFAGLMLLLKDHDVDVRLSTARAISCLHRYA